MRIESMKRASLALLASLMLVGCMNGAKPDSPGNPSDPGNQAALNGKDGNQNGENGKDKNPNGENGKDKNQNGENGKDKNQNGTENAPETQDSLNLNLRKAQVLNEAGELLGEIPVGYVSPVPGGILYSIFTPSEEQKTPPAEYRYFNMESKEDIFLGTLDHQGYEAFFNRRVMDGKVYTLAVAGDPIGEEPVLLYLLSFDLKEGSMKQIPVSEDGYPYAVMDEVDGKLLILNHETLTNPKRATLYEFDPKTETTKPALVFTDSHETFRGISATKDGFYLLRLKTPENGKWELFLDRYDTNYKKISERSLTEAYVQATLQVPGITGREDALREMGINVDKFEVIEDRYLMYENFGLARMVLDLEEDRALMIRDDLWSASLGDGTPYFFELDFESEDPSEPEIVTFVNGKEEHMSFTPSDSAEMLRQVSVASESPKLFMTLKGENITDIEYRIYLVEEHG